MIRPVWGEYFAVAVCDGGGDVYPGVLYAFRRDVKSVKEKRSCEFGSGWVKTVEGKVRPVERGTFTASKAESEARDLINAGQVAGGLFLATGGTVSILNPVGTSLEVTPLQGARPSDLPVKQVATPSLPPR
jgi:hypothetical protein